jgi:hypothetical protein
MWSFPMLDLACMQWQRQAQMQRRWTDLAQRPGADSAQQALGTLWSCLRDLLALPFDLARVQHAAGVRAGAWPRSLLESQRFEQQLGLMETLALGPLARQV